MRRSSSTQRVKGKALSRGRRVGGRTQETTETSTAAKAASSGEEEDERLAGEKKKNLIRTCGGMREKKIIF
jgi:hypothetical protein